MMRKLQFANTKAVSLIFVTAFFFYFSSEAFLRQYVLSQVGSKELNINGILSRLPDKIREDVKNRIAMAKLQDQLKNAKTDSEVIFASLSIARMKSDEDLEKEYARIIDKYPTHPEAYTAYLHFFMNPDTDLKKVTFKDFHDYIWRLPEIKQFAVWYSGLNKLKGSRATSKECIEYLRPLLDSNPKYNDYQQLYVELAEFAFQDGNKDIELQARKKEDSCEKLITLEKAMMEEEMKKEKEEKVK